MHIYDDIRHTLTPIRPSDFLSIREKHNEIEPITAEPDEYGRRIVLGKRYKAYCYININSGRRNTEVLHFVSNADAQKELDRIAEALKSRKSVYEPMYNTDLYTEITKLEPCAEPDPKKRIIVRRPNIKERENHAEK